MPSSHHHHLHHTHSHHIPKDSSILRNAFIIITLFMIIEYIAGKVFNSLALIADAGHMFNDSLSLGLALLALTWLKKSEKWLALLNGGSLIVIAIFILVEAYYRLKSPEPMHSLPMIAVAILGLLVNIVVAKIMLKANHENLNIKAAYFHVLADLMGSCVAILAGLSTYFFSLFWIDPFASLILAIIILKSGISITYQAILKLT